MRVDCEGTSPEFAALVAEQDTMRLDAPGDEPLRQVATMRIEGDNNDEIAARLGCAPRTIGREPDLIRTTWTREHDG